ncbi:MAG: Tn3 family transposase [Gammaproteobacteria bacterium]
MAAIHETAYPRFKPHFTPKELDEVFVLSSNETALLNRKTKATNEISRLGFAIVLKCYQYLGRPIKIDQVNVSVKKYIAKQLSIDSDIDLTCYPKSTFKKHKKAVREHLGIVQDGKMRRAIMKRTALESAQTKENLADIINRVIEEIFRQRFELPAYQSLVRLARAARTVTNNGHYRKISDALTYDQKQLIDHMLESNDDKVEGQWTWVGLKQEPKSPTSNNMRSFISYVNRLKQLREQLYVNIDFITPARLEHLRDEAMITDQADMRKFGELKRYALVIILIYMKLTTAMDNLVHVFTVWIRKIENKAKEKYDAYQLEQAEKTNELILSFYQTLLIINKNNTPKEKIDEIKSQFGSRISGLIEDCRKHLGLTGDKHFGWILKPYNNKRNLLFNLLENLSIFSTSEDKSIENALRFIKHHRSSHKDWIEITDNDEIPVDLSLLSQQWFKLVSGLQKGEPVTKIHKHYYEIAVLHTLMGDLSCSDAYVKDAYVYDDPNKQFISWEEFHENVDDYCKFSELPVERQDLVELLKTKLHRAAQKVNDGYHDNAYLVINEEGKPVLKKPSVKETHPQLDKVKKAVMAKMPVISIVDAMVDVERWLNLSVYFKPLSGNESKIKNYSTRFIATSLSYGCNLGPTQTERCLMNFSRKQIAWLFHHHVTEQRLIKTSNHIINGYNLFELPKHWGPGDSASVDGTFWDMYSQNLLAAHHIRYGRYGGVGYYHVSDQYIALFSNFISSAVHESVYLLDGVVENDSDMKINKVYGDSWAQSEVLFGLSFLMCIAIMPRIKRFKHLHYYKANPENYYEHIQNLFTEKPIAWELIKTHYYDMLRVVISIQKGKVKSSTILRRLCSKSRKNKLYYAFRELGRVVRTEFLLNYIHDPELRRIIQAATCKSEEFNEFINWVRFGGGGVIADNLRFSQRKIIKFNHLLANILIFHTVVHQTKAVNNLREDGVDIPDEVLTGFSPYWRDHLNRFGVFTLDMGRNTAEIDYELANI